MRRNTKAELAESLSTERAKRRLMESHILARLTNQQPIAVARFHHLNRQWVRLELYPERRLSGHDLTTVSAYVVIYTENAQDLRDRYETFYIHDIDAIRSHAWLTDQSGAYAAIYDWLADTYESYKQYLWAKGSSNWTPDDWQPPTHVSLDTLVTA